MVIHRNKEFAYVVGEQDEWTVYGRSIPWIVKVNLVTGTLEKQFSWEQYNSGNT